jgi:DNA polymerase I-like protein with 3'-5' exonuclease and polymerase domains
MLGVTNFNVNSPIQMKQLFKILGCGDLESLDEKNLLKAAYRHPLINRIVDLIVGPPTAQYAPEFGIRGLRKLKSTYLRTDDDIEKSGDKGAKEYKGRILSSYNPHGTDTGRLASKEHHYWCGWNGTNVPRGPEIKQTLIADAGFRLAEVDLEQAESRDTAFIAGCEPLITAVSGKRDFHSVNASSFFGVPYASIYSDTLKKTLNKILRDLAKRVNHGANYNMGADVLVETMGLVNIYVAAAALNLPKLWTPRQIAQYLLDCFHKTYPDLQSTYYPGVIHEITTTKMLTSRAVHKSDFQVAGWVRYCFKNPKTDKRALNAYIAHCPQSLNAMTLNKAFMKVFYEIAINPQHLNNFRLLAQIHDSILFQFREGYEELADKVKACMEIPVTITGYDGKSRTFIVPAAIKAGKDGKGAVRWSETE